MTLVEENQQIAGVFENIKEIAESYLSQGYPAAPDPDEYIEAIEQEIGKYNELAEVSE